MALPAQWAPPVRKARSARKVLLAPPALPDPQALKASLVHRALQALPVLRARSARKAK
jgi:hypothetical protein